jgi:hypothetical protein
VEENVKAISDLHQVFGNIDVATRMMPKFQQMSALLAAVGRGDESNMAYLAARGMELRGALINPKTHQIDEERFAKEAEMMTNVVIGSPRPRWSARLHEFHSASRSGRAAAKRRGNVPTHAGRHSGNGRLQSRYRAEFIERDDAWRPDDRRVAENWMKARPDGSEARCTRARSET